MSDIVNWGVLSTALIATGKVIPGMQRCRHARIVALASRDQSAADRVAARLGIPRAYGSYEALLADPDIEAVYNPLPNHLHVPWTIRAMEAGKHVLCEKPIALDAAEAEQLLDARHRTGKLVAEAFMTRHTPWWQRARTLAQNGALGEVKAIQTFFSYSLTDPANVRNQADIGGGGLYDIGCYAIDTARFLFDAEPLRAAACIDRDPTMAIDRLTSAVLEFPGGRHLTFTCGTQIAPHQRVTVIGTKARLEVVIPFNAPTDAPCQLLIDDGDGPAGGRPRLETFDIADQYTLQGDAFSRAVLGHGPLAFPIENAVANMRVIDTVFRAADTGTWEAVPQSSARAATGSA
jgi:predicted dehydrogenase